jgi:hypothetical protein
MLGGRLGGAELQTRAEAPEAGSRTIGGSLLNYFRYDYEDLTEPTYMDVTLDVTLVSDLFDAATNRRVHSVESRTTNGDTAYQIIMAQGNAIADRLQADGLIR